MHSSPCDRTMESCPGADSTASDPPGLKVSLFPHQKQGLAWAQWRERQRPAGGILGEVAACYDQENRFFSLLLVLTVV
jgi:hypothetical protein